MGRGQGSCNASFMRHRKCFGDQVEAGMQEKRRRPAQQLARRTETVKLSQYTWPIVGFGLLTLLLFGTVLFRGDTRVLGNQTTDLYAQFIAWRDFGFRQLRAGNLALWNPHIYAGAPYFGGFQGGAVVPAECAVPGHASGASRELDHCVARLAAWGADLRVAGISAAASRGVLCGRSDGDVVRGAFPAHLRRASSALLHHGVDPAGVPGGRWRAR